jgi:hypothetical protein
MGSRRAHDEQRAAEQAAANLRLEGIELTTGERALIERRRCEEITQEEFLKAARQLAVQEAEESR